MTRSSEKPYSIRVFVPGGRPDGLRVIEKSNWTGLGIVFPRSEYADVKGRDEFGRTGVYILVGPADEGDLPTIYVGQGDPVKARLDSHYATKDFWTWAVFFVTKDNSLNKAHIGHLEARLLQLAKGAKRSQLDNSNTPDPSPLSEAESADMENFLVDILSVLPLVNLGVFEKPQDVGAGQQVLELHARGVHAKGYESGDGFVVLAGSDVHSEETPTLHNYLRAMRKSLVSEGVIVPNDKHFQLAENYEFNSPSQASSVVLASTNNGREAWKDPSGRTLKEIQESTAKAE